MNFCKGSILVILLLAGWQLGCSRDQRVKVYPVVGKLLIDGQVAEKVLVYFYPLRAVAGANPIPFGIVGPDGTYRPSTYVRGDGLPSGEYTVTVVWPRYIEFDGQEIASDDRLAGKYSDRARSTIKMRVTVDTVELPLIEL
jgi:hypothetical protein